MFCLLINFQVIINQIFQFTYLFIVLFTNPFSGDHSLQTIWPVDPSSLRTLSSPEVAEGKVALLDSHDLHSILLNSCSGIMNRKHIKDNAMIKTSFFEKYFDLIFSILYSVCFSSLFLFWYKFFWSDILLSTFYSSLFL